MLIPKVLARMLAMGKLPWQVLLGSLRLCCLMLLGALISLLLYQESGSTAHLQLAARFQDFAQLALLTGTLAPVCLEDLLPSGPGNPPGSSRR